MALGEMIPGVLISKSNQIEADCMIDVLPLYFLCYMVIYPFLCMYFD